MVRTSDKRERLLAAARKLFHQHGFAQTSLSDIATESGVPLGNVYYYFRSKEELVHAITQCMADEFTARVQGLEQRTQDPRARLVAYLDAMALGLDEQAVHGCPVGTLCQELSRSKVAPRAHPEAVLRLELAWLREQFERLGAPDAPQMAHHVMARLQGATLLAASLNDPHILSDEIDRCRNDVRRLPGTPGQP